jgi:hypothetical protein
MPGAWYDDTDPKALEFFIELHRKMTPGERMARVFELSAFTEGCSGHRYGACTQRPMNARFSFASPAGGSTAKS